MQDARNFLHTDDAVRIGGYIATLESLGIQLVAVRACSSERDCTQGPKWGSGRDYRLLSSDRK